jgi:serine/threonine protein phosphatase 1
MHASNVWNIDTGAGFWGKLSALDIDTKEFWQSEPVKDLYPGEKGRSR